MHRLFGNGRNSELNVFYYFYTPLLSLGAVAELDWRRQAWLHTASKWQGWSRLSNWRKARIIVPTEYQKSQLMRLGARSAVVVPGSTVSARTGPGSTSHAEPMTKKRIQNIKSDAKRKAGIPDRFTVGYLGHFSPAKGMKYLVDAFRLVAPRKDVQLAVAHSGKGKLPRRTKALLDALLKRSRAQLFSVVSPLEFLSACDVVVLPFPSSSVHHIPLVLVESMAACTPVITTDVGGIAEALTDGVNGFLVAPRDSSAIADGIKKLANDSCLARQMSIAAREHFEGWLSRETLCEKIETVINGEQAVGS